MSEDFPGVREKNMQARGPPVHARARRFERPKLIPATEEVQCSIEFRSMQRSQVEGWVEGPACLVKEVRCHLLQGEAR